MFGSITAVPSIAYFKIVKDLVIVNATVPL